MKISNDEYLNMAIIDKTQSIYQVS